MTNDAARNVNIAFSLFFIAPDEYITYIYNFFIIITVFIYRNWNTTIPIYFVLPRFI